MKLATWNVNSVRAREERLLRWLGAAQPDVVCLQELKVHGRGLPGGAPAARPATRAPSTARRPTTASRSSRARADGRRARLRRRRRRLRRRASSPRASAACASSASTCRTAARSARTSAPTSSLAERLRAYLDRHATPRRAAGRVRRLQRRARAARRAATPTAGQDTVLFHPDARAALASCRGWGLVDTFRLHHHGAGLYSWWDYRMLALPEGPRAAHRSRAAQPAARRALPHGRGSTATSARASSRPTTPRCSSELDSVAGGREAGRSRLLHQALQQLDLAGVVEVVGGDAPHQAADRLATARRAAREVVVRQPRDGRAQPLVTGREQRLVLLPPRLAQLRRRREPVRAGACERAALLPGQPAPRRVLPVRRVERDLPGAVARRGRAATRPARRAGRATLRAGSGPCQDRRSKASSSSARSVATAGPGLAIAEPPSRGSRARAGRARPRRARRATPGGPRAPSDRGRRASRSEATAAA